jgi:hypothetical protein
MVKMSLRDCLLEDTSVDGAFGSSGTATSSTLPNFMSAISIRGEQSCRERKEEGRGRSVDEKS